MFPPPVSLHAARGRDDGPQHWPRAQTVCDLWPPHTLQNCRWLGGKVQKMSHFPGKNIAVDD